jgi:hypothetical protein
LKQTGLLILQERANGTPGLLAEELQNRFVFSDRVFSQRSLSLPYDLPSNEQIDISTQQLPIDSALARMEAVYGILFRRSPQASWIAMSLQVNVPSLVPVTMTRPLGMTAFDQRL